MCVQRADKIGIFLAKTLTILEIPAATPITRYGRLLGAACYARGCYAKRSDSMLPLALELRKAPSWQATVAMHSLSVETVPNEPTSPLVSRPMLPRRCSAQLWWLAAANFGVLVLLALRLSDHISRERPTSTTLDRVLKSGVLRVGITADYPPFTLRCSGGAGAVGSDIDEAADLAHSLGATLELVLTTWSELEDALVASAFDIGVGGISDTLQRRRAAAFSMPYIAGGKVLVARCDSPLLALDGWAALRAVPSLGALAVNPGGTNERSIRAELPLARVVLVEANGEQFDLVVRGQVNGTVTDRVEAQLRLRCSGHCPPAVRGDDLCHGPLLQPGRKAYMLPRDDLVWARYVDGWLEGRLQSGAANASLQRWLWRAGTLLAASDAEDPEQCAELQSLDQDGPGAP